MKGDDRTHGLWGTSAPPAPPTGPLDRHIVADVVIVGGGFTGCSAALHLAQAGRRVAVLEAADIGFGGSGRNVGLVNAGMWVMPEQLPGELGDTHGERLLEQLGDAPRLVFEIVERYSIECQAVRAGTLHCAVGRSGFAEVTERHRQWHARGADVELLDASRTRQLVGGGAYSGALLDRRAGTIQPLAYARGLASAAILEGAAIFTGTSALDREDRGDAWTVTTARGSVTAPWVIVATDAYSQGLSSPLREEQVMLPYFNLATAPLPDDQLRSILPQRQGVWDTKQILSSFRLDAAGRLIFGSVGALRGSGGPIHRGWARRELARMFPALRDVRFEHQWFGQIGMTDNALPRLHMPDRNIVSISGYNGRGIAPGTTFGLDLARIVTGERAIADLSLPLTGTGRASLRAAKAAFYEAGAQIAHLSGARF